MLKRSRRTESRRRVGSDGTIKEIGLRSTRLTTQFGGRVVTIPNSKFASNAVVNVSSEPSRNITLNLSLTYNIDEHKVKLAMNILKGLAIDNANVENEVTISFNSFETYSLNILFMYRIKKDSNIFETQSEMKGKQQEQTNTVRHDIFREAYHGGADRLKDGRNHISSARGHSAID